MGLFDFFKKRKQQNKTIKRIEAIEQSEKIYCPKCGSAQRNSNEFCNVCGQKLNKKVEKEPDYVYQDNEIKVTATVEEHTNIFNQPYNQVLAYAMFLNKYPTIKGSQYLNENDYPHFMFANAGVQKIHKLHQELENKGFYEHTRVCDGLGVYKVGELKDLALKINVQVKGKKDEIIKAIADSGKDSEIEAIIKSKFYKVSNMAKSWLSEHKIEIDYYYSGESCSLKEYKSKRSKFTKEALEIKKLNKEIASDKELYGRWGYYGLAGIYEKDNKREALKNYLMCLRLDCSGCYNTKKLQVFGKSTFLEDGFVDIANIPPALIRQIKDLADYFSMDLVDEVFQRKLPLDVLDKTTFTDITTMICEGSFDNLALKEYRTLLKNKFIELVKSR